MIYIHVGFVYIFTITSHPYHFTERIILTGYLVYMQSNIRKTNFQRNSKNIIFLKQSIHSFHFLINEQVQYLVTSVLHMIKKLISLFSLTAKQIYSACKVCGLLPFFLDLKYLVLHFLKPNMYVTDYILIGCLRFAHYKLFSFDFLDIMSWYCNSWASYYFNIWY